MPRELSSRDVAELLQKVGITFKRHGKGLVSGSPNAYNGAAMIQRLEEAINKVKQLPPTEQEAIAEIILAELRQTAWDKEIEEDLKAGRLDQLIQEAEEDIAAGRTQPL